MRRMSALPVACTLDPDARAKRREGLLQNLLDQAAARVDLPEGYSFRFPPSDETLTLIARVVNAERRCCPFLQFTVTVLPGDGPMHLDLTGPPGTREFLSALLDA